MRLLRRILKILIGLVFFVSSITKLMDPVGTGLTVEAYMNFFHLSFLKPAAFVMGEILSVVEATLAVMLVTGVWRRLCALATMSLLGIFTIVSILLVIFNPQMSCGCFGRFIDLTHAQTLYKNLILWAMALPAFIPVYQAGKAGYHRYVAFGIAELAIMSFAVYSLCRLPLVDFSEFSQSHIIVSESEEEDNTYEYPRLPVFSSSGEDRSDDVIDGRVAVISVYDPSDMDAEELRNAATFAQNAINAGWNVVVLSSGEVQIPGMEVLQADYKKLITLNRSNGGVTLLDYGYIMNKFHASDLPGFDEMEEMYSKDSVELYVDTSAWNSLFLQAMILVVLAAMLFI